MFTSRPLPVVGPNRAAGRDGSPPQTPMGGVGLTRSFRGLPLLAWFLAAACGDATTNPPNSAPAGRYTLSWFYQGSAPMMPGIPGVSFVTDDCGNGADAPNASFVFSDSTALTLQESPQEYGAAFVGNVTDCAGVTAPFFDIAAGSYVFVDGQWLTLEGDLTHPHLDGTLEQAGDTLEIQLRPGQPGLPYPLTTVERLGFRRAK